MSSVSTGEHASATQRWSIVACAAAGAERSPREALGELCAGYWYPVYAYVRRSGHAPAIAADIARAFLGHLVENSGDAARRGADSHFRRFLLDRLRAFLGSDWREVGDEAGAPLPLPDEDVETRYARECRASASPERAFERAFACAVLARALGRLADEAQGTGHAAMYAALAPFLVRDPAHGETEEIADRLHTRVLTVAIALRRLRERLREIVGEELADVVLSPDALDAERDALHAALRADDPPA